jgi:ribose transport system ATP-binding protein
VQALAQVDMDLARGEVHALVGENGAGKSTLSRILAGLTSPDSGSMTLAGRPFSPAHRQDAEHCGVTMVMQELNLVSSLTVAEGLFLDRLPRRWGWIDSSRLHSQAREVLDRMGMAGLDPGMRIGSLGVGQQQMVEVAAGLARPCDLLILDEPTAALTDAEIDLLFGRIAELKAAGASVLYISHRMEEILRIADRITVLRDGRKVACLAAAGASLDQIVRLMVGRDLGTAMERPPRRPGPVALRVAGLCREPAVKDVSFEVHRGEILGFAGLMGSGRTETMRAIFGADLPTAGTVHLAGRTEPALIRSPADAVRQGLALLTEDRKEQGLLLPLSLVSNITLPSLRRFSNGLGWVRRTAESMEASRWIQTLAIRCRDAGQRTGDLSGGNQQKVVLAKWLSRDCDVLIFDEPTRGIDVGAKFEIYQVLDDLAAKGKALVVVSSDLPELMALCDRIAVMSAGRISATFGRGQWTSEAILNAALAGYVGARSL